MLATLTERRTKSKRREASPAKSCPGDRIADSHRDPTNPRRRQTAVHVRHSHSPVITPPAEKSAPMQRERTIEPHQRLIAVKPAPTSQRAVGWFRSFLHSQPVEKSFITFGFAAAFLLIFVFGSDLLTGWPFQHLSATFGISNVICGLGLAYLSWDARKDLR